MRYLFYLRITAIIFFFLFTGSQVKAQLQQEPFTIENYYKIKWGYAERHQRKR